MRGKQALKNMVASLLLQVIVLLSGLILPRFILEAYGSSVNGMITSVNQFFNISGSGRSRSRNSNSCCSLYTSCVETDGRSEFNSFGDKKIL